MHARPRAAGGIRQNTAQLRAPSCSDICSPKEGLLGSVCVGGEGGVPEPHTSTWCCSEPKGCPVSHFLRRCSTLLRLC